MPQPRAYWDLRFVDGASIRREEAEEELIARLRQSVRLRMIADVPLGAFLSGGVDSSAVVAMMAGLSPQPVSTFSIAFGAKGFDESAYAATIARRYRTDHHVREVDPNQFDLLDRLATIYDEPFGDSSALPTLRVCETARESVTVALSGDGGDEVFAGYRRYRWHSVEERVRRFVPPRLRAPLFGLLGAVYPKLDWAPRPLRAKAILQELARNAADAYFASVSVCGDALRRRLVQPRSVAQSARLQRRRIAAPAYAPDAAATIRCRKVQYADFKTYLPGDILTKVDRASMALVTGGAGSASRPYPGRMGGAAAAEPEIARPRGQTHFQSRRSNRMCRAKSCTGPNRAFRAARRLVSRALAATGAQRLERAGAAAIGPV